MAIYEAHRCSSHHHQGACEASPAESGGHSGPGRGQAVRTLSFTLAVGFILPVRLMSALKEISEIPANKRRGLVRIPDQGWGTWSGPDGQSFPQETYLHEGFFASPSEETQGVRLPMSPKKKSGCNSDRRAGAPDHRHPPWVGGHATTGMPTRPVRPPPQGF